MNLLKILFRRYCVIVLSIFILTSIHAQTAIVSSGGVTTGNGSSVSYSLGELVNGNYTGSNGNLALGIQQPFEIQVVNGIDDTRISLLIQAFPNPTTDYLTLKSENFDFTNAAIQLYDMEGRLLWHKAMATNEARISLLDFAAAIYILRIMDNQKEIKSFKIIKK